MNSDAKTCAMPDAVPDAVPDAMPDAMPDATPSAVPSAVPTAAPSPNAIPNSSCSKLGSVIDSLLQSFMNNLTGFVHSIVPKERKKQMKREILDLICMFCTYLPFSKKSLGILTRSLHTALPGIIFIVITLSRSKWLCYSILFFLAVVSFMFFFFDTCLVSAFENRIIGDDFNIIDPFLEMINVEINFENRLKSSYGIGLVYMVLIITIYIYL